jgi:hypothetical protein
MRDSTVSVLPDFATLHPGYELLAMTLLNFSAAAASSP